MKTILLRHIQVLFDSLGKMAQTPLPTIMTTAVLGVAISLPLMLFKISDSLGLVTNQWQGTPQITVFLKLPAIQPQNDATLIDDTAINFGHTLLEIPEIRDIEYISPQQALSEFQQSSEWGDLLENLPDNPLPPLLVVYPYSELANSEVEALTVRLSNMPQVDSISYDQLWLERLSAMIDLLEYAVLVLSTLMSAGVILIISNTVRLGILNQRKEIDIIDQIGGNHSFIRRPFLYWGVLQGIAGALVAVLIANTGLIILSKPVQHLAQLYDSNMRIDWVDFTLFSVVVVITAVLGWVAARFTVGNYLRKLTANVSGK